jgi:hypothetical protein
VLPGTPSFYLRAVYLNDSSGNDFSELSNWYQRLDF